MKNQVYLSLGSNIDPELNLPAAVSLLEEHGEIVASSTVWETAPLGVNPQPNYLNAVVRLDSDLEAREIQDQVIPAIETSLGRIRTADRYAPRTMDIDILLFNQEVLRLDHRPIPSPEIASRPFVAIPLAEIAPDYVHPVLKRSLAEIARKHPVDQKTMRPRLEIKLKRAAQPPGSEQRTA
jgi:2-amino-4-hydroxy-6-hydroxymethyldihydropteridine diphosphokinase